MHPCDGCRRNLSARFTLDWVMAAGTDWGNGSRGPSITITLPASNEKRHLFLR